MIKDTKIIYVCSPLSGTKEEVIKNIENAKRYCRSLVMDKAVVPIAPHIYFTQFLDDESDRERQIGMKAGLLLLEMCDELWVFGDKVTAGMQKEIIHAYENGIMVRIAVEKVHYMATATCLSDLIKEEDGIENE